MGGDPVGRLSTSSEVSDCKKTKPLPAVRKLWIANGKAYSRIFPTSASVAEPAETASANFCATPSVLKAAHPCLCRAFQSATWHSRVQYRATTHLAHADLAPSAPQAKQSGGAMRRAGAWLRH
eukprot:scaffold238418_cov33-Tisochrysis_lutea.AAC.1